MKKVNFFDRLMYDLFGRIPKKDDVNLFLVRRREKAKDKNNVSLLSFSIKKESEVRV